MDRWIDDFEWIRSNAHTRDWFVSPLQYAWGGPKREFDQLFARPGEPDATFDGIASPIVFKSAMNVRFRAQMMVYAVMRQPIARSFGVEIESGLLSFYQLDFLACISQWVYVVEGYCRKLFAVPDKSGVRSTRWKLPVANDPSGDRLIESASKALAAYLDDVLFQSVSDFHVERLNRHLLLHGNAANKKLFSQKNGLVLLFLLDALVLIEMVKNRAFPTVFADEPGDAERIRRREVLYATQLQHVFEEVNLLKVEVLKEHL